MPRPEWNKVGVEVTIGVAFVGFALAVLLVPAGVDEAQRDFFIVFLFTLFVFIHFQYFHDGTALAHPRQFGQQSIVERKDLDIRLKAGYTFIAALDNDHFVLDAPRRRRRASEGS